MTYSDEFKVLLLLMIEVVRKLTAQHADSVDMMVSFLHHVAVFFKMLSLSCFVLIVVC